jgi:serine/threonine protein phosphatase PrpC
MAARYRRKNVIWSSLGPESTFETFESEAKLMPSDRLLMITDGLYSHFSKEQIRDFSLMSRSPLELVERLSVGIEKIGPSDDYSLVAISLEAGN